MSHTTAVNEAVARLIPLMNEDLGAVMTCVLSGHFKAKEEDDGATTER